MGHLMTPPNVGKIQRAGNRDGKLDRLNLLRGLSGAQVRALARKLERRAAAAAALARWLRSHAALRRVRP